MKTSMYRTVASSIFVCLLALLVLQLTVLPVAAAPRSNGPDMAKIDAFFNLMFEQKASDLHLASGNNPMLRINAELQRVEHAPLENDELKKTGEIKQ